jgi:hypothetical protein
MIILIQAWQCIIFANATTKSTAMTTNFSFLRTLVLSLAFIGISTTENLSLKKVKEAVKTESISLELTT